MNAIATETLTGMPAVFAPVSFAQPAAFGQPVEGAALTDVGKVRERNEDDYLLRPEVGLFAVADGMGGHAAGDVASALCVEALSMAVADCAPEDDPRAVLSQALTRANMRIYAMAMSQPHMYGMGTTVAAIWLSGDRAYLAHVGDSRVYRLRGGKLEALTLDHSPLGDGVRYGQLTREEAEAIGPCNMITRALGTRPEVEVEMAEVAVLPGDRFLVCSDGISDLMSEDLMACILQQHDTPAGATRALALAALDAGGRDNLTAVVVDAG